MSPTEKTRTVLLVVLVAFAGVGATGTVAADSAAGPTQITECTTIDEAGDYVVVRDLEVDEREPCLRIVADDVHLDAQGNNIQPGPVFPRTVPSVFSSGIVVDGASNVSVENFTVFINGGSPPDPGVFVSDSSGVTIKDGKIGRFDTEQGVLARHSSDVVVDNLTVSGQVFGGILFIDVQGGAVRNSDFSLAPDSMDNTVLFSNTSGVVVEQNRFPGFPAAFGAYGISLKNSDENTVRGNLIGGVQMLSASRNELTGNEITEVVELRGTSEANQIYNNRFDYDASPPRERVRFGPDFEGDNEWSTTIRRGENVAGGRFLAGNYYIDPDGNGTSQTCADDDRDGICDEPLALADGNVDRYPLSTVQAEDGVTYYQVDLVSGEPIKELGREEANDYSRQGRLIRYAHGTSGEPKTREGSSVPSLDEEVAECVDSEPIAVDAGANTASVTVTVEEGCDVELSLTSYEKVGPGWSLVRQQTQRFVDAETRALGAGTYTLTVDLPESDGEGEDTDD